jgi:heptosyltransferase-2
VWDDVPKSVLVVQTAFIGDVVLTIPLLEGVKILWAETALDVMVRPPADNLLETLPFVRNIWVYDKLGRDRGPTGFMKWQNCLFRQKYDLAIVPHRSLRSGLLARLARIPVRLGFDRGGGRFMHTQKLPYHGYLHEIQRNLQLLSPFGPLPQVDPPVVLPSEADVQIVDAKVGWIENLTIALAPGSAWFTKRWPDAYYLALGRKLAASGCRVLLFGGKEDRELCRQIAAGIGPAAMDLSGALTLRQSVEALRRCALLVTNDSAPTHLGIAAGTRVLTLFGSTIPEYGFAPLGPRSKTLGIEIYCRPCTDHGRRDCPQRHFRCLREITADRVLAEIRQMLEVS